MTGQADLKVVAIIQARMSSSRLPGKVLLDLGGHPMLEWVIERTRMAKRIHQVVVATTSDPADDPIEALCRSQGYPCYRGSLYDVLDRYYQTARQFKADVIVRITADCPLIDPEVVDKTIAEFLSTSVDFAANRLPPPWGRTYPIGLDTEVCSIAGLELAWKEAKLPYQREHVMPFFYDQPGRFQILHVNHPVDYGTLRWTVDTLQDLILIRNIVEHFQGRLNFSWLEVLDYYQSHPELAGINQMVIPKDYHDFDKRHSASQQEK